MTDEPRRRKTDAESNGLRARWGERSLGISGPTGIIALLILSLITLGYVGYLHLELNTKEHASIVNSSDRLACVIALDTLDRRVAIISGDPCRYLREGAAVRDERRAP